jgi:hypothetical protein
MQFLLNPDGSVPQGANLEALQAAGVLLVIPTARHVPAEGMMLVEGRPVQDGDVWRQVWDEVPAPPPEPPAVPQTISPFQARAALLGAGLLDTVEAMLAHPDTPRTHRIAWEFATEIRRASPLVVALAGALGLDEATLDALFIAAAGIEA